MPSIFAYLLSNLSRECSYEQYPAALRASALQVLKEVKERNGWRPGDTVRIVCHSFKPLKKIELAEIMAECVAELATCSGKTLDWANGRVV